MTARWFRISFAKNAFLRLLEADGLSLETISVMHAVRAMEEFSRSYRPQHGETDELRCQWGPVTPGQEWEFAVVRRMTRHDHPETRLRLALRYPLRESDPSGQARVESWRDVRTLAGYAATRGRRPRRRVLEQAPAS